MSVMNAARPLDQFISELTDTAFETVSKAGSKWNSVELELAIGQRIEAAVRREYRFQRWVKGIGRAFSHEFMNRLADSVYRLALEAGIRGSFVDLELGLWIKMLGQAPSHRW